MAATGTLSKGITLAYDLVGVPTPLPDLQDIPELGGDVEKVEITVLADSNRRYINGIKDYGDLAFTFLYGNAATDSYRILKGLEAGGLSQDWTITLPDTTKFEFSGFASVKTAASGINEAITFTLNISLNSGITITNPAQ